MRASRCSGVRSGSMRGRRRKVGAMSELRPDAQADGERRVGVVEPARDVEAQRPYRRSPAHADAHAGMPVCFGAVEGAAAVDEPRAPPALREVALELDPGGAPVLVAARAVAYARPDSSPLVAAVSPVSPCA